jgi:hypothetical protein
MKRVLICLTLENNAVFEIKGVGMIKKIELEISTRFFNGSVFFIPETTAQMLTSKSKEQIVSSPHSLKLATPTNTRKNGTAMPVSTNRISSHSRVNSIAHAAEPHTISSPQFIQKGDTPTNTGKKPLLISCSRVNGIIASSTDSQHNIPSKLNRLKSKILKVDK